MRLNSMLRHNISVAVNKVLKGFGASIVNLFVYFYFIIIIIII